MKRKLIEPLFDISKVIIVVGTAALLVYGIHVSMVHTVTGYSDEHSVECWVKVKNKQIEAVDCDEYSDSVRVRFKHIAPDRSFIVHPDRVKFNCDEFDCKELKKILVNPLDQVEL